MKTKILPADMLLNQLEEALEERQKPDRRKTANVLPSGVKEDRRKSDRRAGKKR